MDLTSLHGIHYGSIFYFFECKSHKVSKARFPTTLSLATIHYLSNKHYPKVKDMLMVLQNILSNNGSYANDNQVKIVQFYIIHQKIDLPLPFVFHTENLHHWYSHFLGKTKEEIATQLVDNLDNKILNKSYKRLLHSLQKL